jgi:hypothetical protein
MKGVIAMTVGELADRLSELDPTMVVVAGVRENPSSYRRLSHEHFRAGLNHALVIEAPCDDDED